MSDHSVTLWRIGADTPAFTADDRTGAGAKLTGGRWNRAGAAVLYCSESIALSCLETLAHTKLGSLPLNRYLVAIHVPPSVWAAVEFFDFGAHVGWDAIPCGKVSLDVGDAWLSRKSSALLKVPSVIVPEENNVLINPAHPDAAKLKFSKRRRWTYDPRLVQVSC